MCIFTILGFYKGADKCAVKNIYYCIDSSSMGISFGFMQKG